MSSSKDHQSPKAAGKQPEDRQDGNPSQTSNDPSLASRLANSASSLAQAAFSPPSVVDSLQSVAGPDAKGLLRRRITLLHQLIMSVLRLIQRLPGAIRPHLISPLSTTPSGPGHQVPEMSNKPLFDAFLEPSMSLGNVPHVESGQEQSVPEWNARPTAVEEPKKTHDATPLASTNGYLGTHAEGDGAAVVELLSQPGLLADDDPGQLSFDSFQDTTEELPLNLGSSSAGDKSGFAQSNAEPGAEMNGLIPSLPSLDNTSDAIGSSQPWYDILNRYHDEVWGDALSLVQEARQELAEAVAEGDPSPDDRPALRRLKALLGHVKPRSSP